ncbi:MAG: hypothetical protein R3B13_32815 [Polyangiaceae bacterium]
MPLPPVVIELSPRDTAAEYAESLISACSEAVHDGDCVAGSASSPTQPRAVAIVSSNGDFTQVRVELGMRHGAETRWSVRTLSFDGADPRPERSRTIGFVIGTLVGEIERGDQATPVPPPAPKDPTPTPLPEPPPPVARPAPTAPAQKFLWFEAAPTVGTGLETGAPRFGAALRVGVTPLPPVELLLGIGYAVRPRDDDGLAARFATVELGAGVTHALTKTVALNAAASAFAELLTVDVTSSPADEGNRLTYGTALRVGPYLRVTPWLSVMLQGQAALRDSGTRVQRGGREVARQPPLSAAGFVGVRFDVF